MLGVHRLRPRKRVYAKRVTPQPATRRSDVKRTLAPLAEKDFQAQVMELAQWADWLTYHTHDSRRSPAGFPDCVFVRGDRLVFAELKREKGGRVSPAQRAWIDALEATGQAEVYLWRPSDWPEICRVLSRHP